MNWQKYVTEINRNFIIRYNYKDVSKKTALIGAGRYVVLLEKARKPEQMALQHFLRVMNSGTDENQTITLRGGLTTTFIPRK